jgi:integrase
MSLASLRKRGRVWYVRYRDAHGKQIETKAGPDRSVAQRIARELESRSAAIKAGVADPREASWVENERKPLSDHVHDWHGYMLASGDTQQHADQSRDRVLRLIESSRIMTISGLSIGAVQSALADLSLIKGRRGNPRLSPSSVRHHARAIKSFCKWLWKDGRAKEDVLVHLGLPKIGEKFERRALEPHEAEALIGTTQSLGVVRGGMTGGDRSVLYAVALGTGFRAKECRSLTAESFRLDTDPPTIVCAAEHTKNGLEAVQPIRPELAAMLRSWLHGKAHGKPVFAFRLGAAAGMVRSDLEAAGIAQSESYDFHSLRHSYVTMLIKSGASVKVCQELARHADPKLTMNIYTHLTAHDLPRSRGPCPHIAHTCCLIGSHRDRWDRRDFQS